MNSDIQHPTTGPRTPESKDVQELFGDGVGAPEPRTALIWALLLIGAMLAALGMACSPAPGAVLILLAWYLAENERDRVSSGYLPTDAMGVISVARTASFIAVVFVILLFIIQGFLLGSDSYDQWWSQIIATWLHLGPAAPPPPAP